MASEAMSFEERLRARLRGAPSEPSTAGSRAGEGAGLHGTRCASRSSADERWSVYPSGQARPRRMAGWSGPLGFVIADQPRGGVDAGFPEGAWGPGLPLALGAY